MSTRVYSTHSWVQSSGSASLSVRAGFRRSPCSLRRSRMAKTFKGFIALWPIPEMRRGGIRPPSPVLAPGSALGSRPRVALSSAQVASVYRTGLQPSKGSLLGLGRRRASTVTHWRSLASDAAASTDRVPRRRDVGDHLASTERTGDPRPCFGSRAIGESAAARSPSFWLPRLSGGQTKT